MLLVCFFTVAAFAGNGGAQVFSNEDLEKYRSKEIKAPEPQAALLPETKEEKKKAAWIPARYEVAYEPTPGSAKKIIIPVTINNSLTVPMLLDTGSTGMLISLELARKLGVFKKDAARLYTHARGIGRTVPAIMTVINTVQVGKARSDFIPTIVTDSAFKGFDGLIGMDFMSQYAIQINTKKHVVVFEEIQPEPDMPGGHSEEWWKNTFHDFASARSDWKEFRVYLNNTTDDTPEIRELKPFVEQQYKEADKLVIQLNNYAIDHVVPMEWREY
ncbi:MAG: retropepsin-like aspartic protease [Thermodesulfovibrionales bacterium]